MERLRSSCPDHPNCQDCPERNRIENIENVQDLRLGAPSPTDTTSTFSPFYYNRGDFQTAFPVPKGPPPQSKLGNLHGAARKVLCGGSNPEESPNARDETRRNNAIHFETVSLESKSVRSNKAICNRPYISQVSNYRACGDPGMSEYLGKWGHFPRRERSGQDCDATRADGGIGGGRETKEEEEDLYPKPLPRTLIIIGLCLSVFLISLDRTIITTVRIQS
jgi:hypothetical protein